MKHIRRFFENYDSPETPKHSDEEIRKMAKLKDKNGNIELWDNWIRRNNSKNVAQDLNTESISKEIESAVFALKAFDKNISHGEEFDVISYKLNDYIADLELNLTVIVTLYQDGKIRANVTTEFESADDESGMKDGNNNVTVKTTDYDSYKRDEHFIKNNSIVEEAGANELTIIIEAIDTSLDMFNRYCQQYYNVTPL